MVRFGIIRHARTVWNLEKKIQGREDIALCRQGIDEAAHWGDILKFEKFSLIVSSPMIRARQTSEIIAEKIGIDIAFDDNLREQDFGSWEGKKIADIRKDEPGIIEIQESRGWDFCPPEGESRNSVLKRALKAIRKATDIYDEHHVLVVTHNSVIKSILYSLMNNRTFTPDKTQDLKDYHLHMLTWKNKLKIEKLNHIRLQQ